MDAPIGFLGVLFALLIAAGLYDIKTFTIPHAFTFAVAGLFVIGALFIGLSPIEWGWHVLSAALAFIIAFALFVFGMMGGGDVKLFAALALWISPSGLLPLVFWVTMTGLVISLVILLIKTLQNKRDDAAKITWRQALKVAVKTRIPYGPAITIGTLIYFGLAV